MITTLEGGRSNDVSREMPCDGIICAYLLGDVAGSGLSLAPQGEAEQRSGPGGGPTWCRHLFSRHMHAEGVAAKGPLVGGQLIPELQHRLRVGHKVNLLAGVGGGHVGDVLQQGRRGEWASSSQTIKRWGFQ